VRFVIALFATGLLAVPAAVAKDFQPGDLQVCGRDRCVAMKDRPALRALSAFYWGAGRAPRAHPVRPGARAFKLRFGDDYVSGIVASPRLDRFRAYGVNCGRFRIGGWYRVPTRAAAEIRRLATGLGPVKVSHMPVRSC
jgi:hypothetical protein